ncbi:MAG: hypothetical protein AAFY88_29945 [Acidobacteriota bacterium]
MNSFWFDIGFPVGQQTGDIFDLDFKNEDPPPQEVGLLLPAIKKSEPPAQRTNAAKLKPKSSNNRQHSAISTASEAECRWLVAIDRRCRPVIVANDAMPRKVLKRPHVHG